MKGLICFGTMLALIFPLYNVQRKNIFCVDGISSIYFVSVAEGKLVYEIQNRDDISQKDLQNAEGVILNFESGDAYDIATRLDVKIVKEEIVDEMKIIYGYTNLYSDFIYIDGKQSNVQIVQNQGGVTAGFPIILSGYWCIKALFMEIRL